MTKKQIIHVTPHYPPTLGGAEQLIETLVEQLEGAGYIQEVLTSRNGRRAGVEMPSGRTTIRYLWSTSIANIAVIPSLVYRIIRSQGNVIHVHVFQALTLEVAYLAARIRGHPLVAHVHIDLQPTGPLGVVLPYYKRFLFGPIIRRADVVICPTPGYAQLMKDNYRVELGRIAVVPNATDFRRRNAPRTGVSVPARLLFVGRLAPQKNVSMLVVALRMLVDAQRCEVQLEIVGDGEQRSEIVQLVNDLGLARHVVIAGALYGERLQDAYDRSDIFVLPSLYESFGRVLIEAMSKGLPIVATDIVGIRDVVASGRNGLLCAVSAPGLCTAIEEILGNQELYCSMSACNLEDVSRYGWTDAITRISQLYASL